MGCDGGICSGESRSWGGVGSGTLVWVVLDEVPGSDGEQAPNTIKDTNDRSATTTGSSCLLGCYCFGVRRRD